MVELVTHHWAEIFTSRKMASGSYVRIIPVPTPCSERQDLMNQPFVDRAAKEEKAQPVHSIFTLRALAARKLL